MIVTLIGYRGSGKTTLAAPLAERLRWGWVDADVEIERRAGRSIREIFAAEGEAGFRRRERAVMAELLDREKLVVAAGGGAILDVDTRRQMKSAGLVIWLKASVEALHSRISGDETTAERRPDLTASGGPSEIETVLERRGPLYEECADLVLDTEALSAGELTERAARAVEAFLAERARR